MLEGLITGKRARPRRCLLYGTHGIGKSTWAASSPKPIVLATEDGLDDLEVARTPLLRETNEVATWLIKLGGGGHGYETVVIDTVDWLERLILDATARDLGKKSIEEIGYGKGYVMAVQRWEKLLHMLEACRAVGMNIVLLAHAKIERFSPPDADPYDRWQLDLHKLASPLLQEWADEVLFATYRISTVQREEKFGQTRTRPVGSGERLVYTCEAPTHAAKRRIQMPDEIPLEWAQYQRYWPKNQQQQTGPAVGAGDISGMVNEGHSKQRKEKAA